MSRFWNITDILPTCWVCKKPVDSVAKEIDFRTLMSIFVVRCHGETEYFGIDREFLLSNISTLQIGYAFTEKNELPQPQNLLELKSE